MMATIHIQIIHVLKPDLPTFVGSHYYCESGNTGGYTYGTLYTGGQLWDGSGCLSENQLLL